ncbi:pilus assembly protein PilP [Roseateles noduli]|jgi:type IV pilus assembly protein PilP|uniref:pilus assembly protein PilP n=1 Tax=Roseateles noduli TaxID=2052484 RepID=UPI003D650433
MTRFVRSRTASPGVATLDRAPVRALGLLGLALTGALLTGCTSSTDELQQWMEEQRQQTRPTVKPLTPPKTFQPQPYEAQAVVDPFSTQKLTVALRREATQPSSLLAAEMKRRREPLEAFPLDSMTMVGSVSRDGRPYALLRVDNLLYQARVGDYMGQNFGRITKISETEITLREVVQDAAGEWIERTSTLQLQEQGR